MSPSRCRRPLLQAAAAAAADAFAAAWRNAPRSHVMLQLAAIARPVLAGGQSSTEVPPASWRRFREAVSLRQTSTEVLGLRDRRVCLPFTAIVAKPSSHAQHTLSVSCVLRLPCSTSLSCCNCFLASSEGSEELSELFHLPVLFEHVRRPP